MSYKLIIKEEAIADMQEAYDYYEEQQAGLGERFLAALQQRFVSLSEHPQYYGFIDSKQLLRDVSVAVFPYVIVYGIIEDEVRVYAIHPTRKRPKQNYSE